VSADAHRAGEARLRRAALITILLGVPFALFLVLAEDVAEKQVFAWDTSILRSRADHRTPTVTRLMQIVTDIGATLSLTAAALALSSLLLWKRLHLEALFVLLSIGGAALLNVLLKQLFQRPRPDVVAPVVTAHGFAFPSGHTMSSMALACAVVFLCWRVRWRYRWPVSVGAFAFAFLVGVSRLYLGVHYPSDVIAGWLVSLDLVAVIYLLLFHARPTPGERETPSALGPGVPSVMEETRSDRAPAPRPTTHERAVDPASQATDPGGDHGDQA
jgi:membrane-associated phospholipid phosphatase